MSENNNQENMEQNLEIQKYFIDRFGIEVPLEKCKIHLTAYNVIRSLSTVNTLRVMWRDDIWKEIGNEEDFERAMANGEPVQNKTIKSFYFRYYFPRLRELGRPVPELKVEQAPEVAPAPEVTKTPDKVVTPTESQKPKNVQKSKTLSIRVRKEKIIEILKIYGLWTAKENLNKMATLETFSKSAISERQVLEYVLNNSHEFSVSNFVQARKALSRLSFELERYKDEFVVEFLADKELNGKGTRTLRGNKEEDIFINNLADKGLYITALGNTVPPITNVESLVAALKNNSQNIHMSSTTLLKFYEEFGEYIERNPDFERLILGNVSDNLFANGRTKSDDIRKFENLHGIKIYSYDGKLGGRISKETLMRDIISGKVEIMVVNPNQLKQQMKTLPVELQNILNECINEREEGLRAAREYRERLERERATPPPAENIPVSEVESPEAPVDPVETPPLPVDEHLAFYETTDSEIAMQDMLVNIYNLYGREHTLFAMQAYIESGNSALLPRNEASNEYQSNNAPDKVFETLVTSYTKRVLRRMKENDLGNSTNPKESLLEDIIVETYKEGIDGHDDAYMIEQIKQAICQYILTRNIDGFPKDNNATKNVSTHISSRDIFRIMTGAEIDTLLSEKDKDGNPLIVESEIDAKTKKIDNFITKIGLKEGMFISSTLERFDASTDVERSTIGANMYASLSQSKYEENVRRAQLVKYHRDMMKRINELRIEKVKIQAALIQANITEPAATVERVKQIDEELKAAIDRYESFMTSEYQPGRANVMIIAEYESKVRVLKGIDERHAGDRRHHAQYMQKSTRREVVDFDEI